MSVYLIDYENVHFAGLEGVEKLKPQDEVIMFYSQNASTIPMELHVKMMECPAKIQFMHIKKTAKNYLDFQLAAISGYLVATTQQTDFIVISMDTGFDSVLDLWNAQDFVGRKVHFSKRSQIAEISSKPKKRTTKKTVAKKEVDKPASAKATDKKDVAGPEREKKQSRTMPARDRNQPEEVAENTENRQPEEEPRKINAELLLRARQAFALPEEEEKEENPKAKAEVRVETKPEKKPKKEEKTKATAKEKAAPKKAEKTDKVDAADQKEKEKIKARKLTADEKQVIRSKVKEIDLKPAEYTKLYKLIVSCEDKQAYNNELVRVFGQEKCNMIYKATRKAFDDMK